MSDSLRSWTCRDRRIEWGERTLVMGVLNVTPDSFYDGGVYADPHRAVAHASEMIEDGAALIDVGGESSRPGADPVPAEEEMARVVPVVAALRAETHALISVDTTKAVVARAALEAGAHIVNDISALRFDPDMASVVRDYGAGLILMHMQGTPRTMQASPTYADVVREVGDFLKERAAAAEAAGIDRACIALDPGIGFGKTFDHNWALLAGLPTLARFAYPLLVGVSRKRFLGALCDREVDGRLPASLAALTVAVRAGASIIRVHDVKESCDAARVADRISDEERKHGRLDTTASSS